MDIKTCVSFIKKWTLQAKTTYRRLKAFFMKLSISKLLYDDA